MKIKNSEAEGTFPLASVYPQAKETSLLKNSNLLDGTGSISIIISPLFLLNITIP
jgi:hypothetical protein